MFGGAVQHFPLQTPLMLLSLKTFLSYRFSRRRSNQLFLSLNRLSIFLVSKCLFIKCSVLFHHWFSTYNWCLAFTKSSLENKHITWEKSFYSVLSAGHLEPSNMKVSGALIIVCLFLTTNETLCFRYRIYIKMCFDLVCYNIKLPITFFPYM